MHIEMFQMMFDMQKWEYTRRIDCDAVHKHKY